MEFRLPDENDEELLKEYVQEHLDKGEQGISASMGLQGMPYSEWMNKIRSAAEIGDGEWGKYLVLLCFEGDRLAGLLNIRYNLSKELSDMYGDVGYGVRPSERNKGYAARMLRYAVSVCKEKGMSSVRLGCYKDNVASVSVIKKCNGVQVSEIEDKESGDISLYFTIET